METRVHVPNNYFVALSGMINDSKTHYKTGIPCLGGLPVIGALFSENDRTASKNSIIIFIRPQIVNTYEEYKRITEHQEWLYKDSFRLPILKEEFDEGIDMVKLPENE
jgi:type III secretion protein C